MPGLRGLSERLSLGQGEAGASGEPGWFHPVLPHKRLVA